MKILRFFKIHSWYVPADIETYTTLVKLGAPQTRIHKDFLPTLNLITSRHYLIKSKAFFPVLREKLNTAGSQWRLQKERKCRLDSETLEFTAPNTPTSRKSIARLEHKLEAFFARWGYRYYPTFSETGARIKLHVEYGFDRSRSPVIATAEDIDHFDYTFIFGSHKISFSYYQKRTARTEVLGYKIPLYVFELFASAGSDWKSLHRSTFKDTDIGSLKNMYALLGVLQNAKNIKDRI